MRERKFKLNDDCIIIPDSKSIPSQKYCGIGKIVELTTFRPDGKDGCEFWGENACGVLWPGSEAAIYHFEENLIGI